MSSRVDGPARFGFGSEEQNANPIVVRDIAAHSIGALMVTHPGALDVKTYQVLAAQLPDNIAVYVLAVDRVLEYRRSVLSGDELDISLVAIAERFARQLVDLVGRLPYVLLGWSFGGVVGYAVAEAMVARRAPAHLVLLDSIAPGPGDPGSKLGTALPDREALDWFALYLGAKREHPLGFSPDHFTGVSIEDGLRIILDKGISSGALFDGTTVDGLRKVFETFLGAMLRNKQLHDGYTPSPPRWPASLVRPSRGLFDNVARLGWEDLVGAGMPVYHCAGDHYTMLTDPNSAKLISGIVESALSG